MATIGNYNWTTNDGINIHMMHATPEAPKAVVGLVHGIGEHSGRYNHMSDYFVDRGFAFAAYDHRGHGLSEGKRGHTPTYQNLISDLDQFVEQMRAFYPNRPIFLYGHSMGGNILLAYLIKMKPESIQGVITSGAFIKLAFEPSTILVAMGRLMRNILPSFSQSNQLVLEHISRSNEVVEAYKKDPLVHNKVTATLGIGMIETAKMLYNYKDQLNLPMLLMHGSDDYLTSPSGSKAFANHQKGDVTYKEWSGLYHELHNEPEQATVFDYTIHWMNQHLKL